MSLKCLYCKTEIVPLPDEEAEEVPPSVFAKLFYCATCDKQDWIEPEDMGLLSWNSDLEENEAHP